MLMPNESKKDLDDIRRFKDVLLEHYKRRMAKNGTRYFLKEPDYLNDFIPERKPLINVKEAIEAIKKGRYNL